MNEGSIKRYTIEELRRKVEAGESRTDMARINAMSDEDVERAIAEDPDSDIPEHWWEKVEAVSPRPKVAVSIRLDADLVEYFRSSGRGWQTRINAILRAYRNATGTRPG